MKKITTLLMAIIYVSFSSFAQLPKGDRVLAWQVDMTQNANYDSAYAYAQTGCMESIHLTFAWSSIEPNAGNFDAIYINNVLDVADIYYPAFGTKIELQIPTMNTNVKVTPTDLVSTNFDDITMINRFKILLDTLFSHIPNVQLSALNIGNESDIYMGTDAAQYNQYKTFLNAIVPYAKQLYFNIHGTDLKVGTTFTYDGLVGTSTSSLCQTVNNGLDIVALTYYPLNSNFTMESPSIVSSDFSSLVGVYSDTLQPIYFAECGYASSAVCNSSEALQAQFFQNVFSAWDTYYDNIKYLTLFKTTDWSQQEVNDLGVFYGITDTIFKEYLRTLGVRTFPGNGTNKIAYETILCELSDRNWCNTASCNSVGVSTNNNKNEVSVYPNPAREKLTIQSASKIKHIKIYDVFGRLITTIVGNNTLSETINIVDLTRGVYVVNVTSSKGSNKLKFIKE